MLEVTTEQDTQVYTQDYWNVDNYVYQGHLQYFTPGSRTIGTRLKQIRQAILCASHPSAVVAYGDPNYDAEDEDPEGDDTVKGKHKQAFAAYKELLGRDDNWESSKNIATMNQIEQIFADRPQAKILIFGSSIAVNQGVLIGLKKTFGNVVSEILELDGSLTPKKETSVIEKYINSSEPAVMVMSTRAGCEGYNLGCTTDVIMREVDWNPGAEAQVVSWAHRLNSPNIIYVWLLRVKNPMELRVDEKTEIKRQKADVLSKLIQSQQHITTAQKMGGL